MWAFLMTGVLFLRVSSLSPDLLHHFHELFSLLFEDLYRRLLIERQINILAGWLRITQEVLNLELAIISLVGLLLECSSSRGFDHPAVFALVRPLFFLLHKQRVEAVFWFDF